MNTTVSAVRWLIVIKEHLTTGVHLVAFLLVLSGSLLDASMASADTSPKGCGYSIKSEAVVTHYPSLYGTQGWPSVPWVQWGLDYVYKDGFLPSINNYLATTFSWLEVGASQRDAALDEMCNDLGVPFSFYSWTPGVDVRIASEQKVPGWTGPGTGRVRVVHGITVGGLFTLFLPPNWEAASTGTHPIVAETLYDVNENLFSPLGHGKFIGKIVAESGIYDRRGAIGLLWNGGGALGSATANAVAVQQFADIVGWTATYTRGEPHNIFMLGRSRGGTAPLLLASSGHAAFTIKFVLSLAGATKFGTQIANAGATMPAQIPGLGNVTGYSRSWKPGWVYNGPAGSGLSAKEAASRILVGDTLGNLDAYHSPISQGKIDSLFAKGTKLLLVFGSHDEFIPFGTQMEYLAKLRNRGVPVEAHVVLRGGHLRNADLLNGFTNMPGGNVGARFRAIVLDAVQYPGASGTVVTGPDSIVYYDTEIAGAPNANPIRIAALNANSEIPFTLEVPYRVWAQMPYEVFITGPNGTQVRLWTSQGTVDVTIGQSEPGNPLRQTEFLSFPWTGWSGTLVYYDVYIKTPTMGALQSLPWRLAGCNPPGTPLLSVVEGSLPDVTAIDVWNGPYSVKKPTAQVCPHWTETNWGLVRNYQ